MQVMYNWSMSLNMQFMQHVKTAECISPYHTVHMHLRKDYAKHGKIAQELGGYLGKATDLQKSGQLVAARFAWTFLCLQNRVARF